MANYYSDYVGDDSKVYKRIAYDIYLVDVTVGVRGNRVNTTYIDDVNSLPSIYFETALLREPKKAYCDLPFQQRNALLWINDSTYLYVPLPWQGNSSQFNEFYTLLETTFRDRYLSIGLNGEFVGSEWLRVLVR